MFHVIEVNITSPERALLVMMPKKINYIEMVLPYYEMKGKYH